MPTYALPTNIPPLEALYLECPIIYSKTDENNELFYKDSLWEVDLNNPEDLSRTILKINNNDNNVVQQKTKVGKSLLKNLNNNLEQETLNEIFTNFFSKRKTYK
jgi:glycosyltransferase involved in cell wall biosynthesis